jgi:hypothetical protein
MKKLAAKNATSSLLKAGAAPATLSENIKSSISKDKQQNSFWLSSLGPLGKVWTVLFSPFLPKVHRHRWR